MSSTRPFFKPLKLNPVLLKSDFVVPFGFSSKANIRCTGIIALCSFTTAVDCASERPSCNSLDSFSICINFLALSRCLINLKILKFLHQ